MTKTANNRQTLPDPTDHEQGNLRGYRLVLGASIAVYLGLAGVFARCLPDYSLLAWVLMAFGFHSAFVLLSGRERQEP
jgi:hypothetical protein